MSDLANLYIKVDSSGVVTASRDLNKLEGDSRKVESATESVTTGFNKLKTVVMAVAASYAVMKLAEYVKDATLAAARYETLGVVMRVVGNNAGYTGQQMDTFAKGLEKTGISMTEARQSLTQMVQAQLNLNDSSKLARVAQDAAVIGNINSSEAFQRLVTGIQSGQVEMLRTIGINVNFEASYQKVAMATNRSVESFTEHEKAQIRMNAVMDAGTKISGAYESAMDTAGKQVLSLTRHLENLKVLFGLAFTPALAEIIEQITGAVTDVNGELSGKSKDAIADWGNNFRLTIMSIEKGIMELAMGIDKLGGTLSSIAMLGSGLGAGLGKLGLPDFGDTKIFESAAQANIDLEARYKATGKAIEELEIKYKNLEQAMTPAGKAQAKAATDALEATRLAGRDTTKEAAIVTTQQLHIQEQFAKEYAKLTMSTEQAEIVAMNLKLAEFKKGAVNEIQLEEWKQASLKEIKLRAQNEQLALLEELYQGTGDQKYADKQLVLVNQILDAEKIKNQEVLGNESDALVLRTKHYQDYQKAIADVNTTMVTADLAMWNEINSHSREAMELQVTLWEAQAAEYIRLGHEKGLVEDWLQTKKLQYDQDWLRVEIDFYSQLKGYEDTYRTLKFQWIDNEEKRLADLYKDDLAAFKWAQQEKLKLNTELSKSNTAAATTKNATPTGAPAATGQKFQMTWASYVGPLTNAVVQLLNKNQKAIEYAAQAPAREAAAAQAAADAKAVADAAAQVAEQAAATAAQYAADVASKNMDLSIQILELTGQSEAALTAQRLLELSTMDESTQILQRRIYYLQDEAKVAEAAAKAADELAKAQDAAVQTWKNSISTLVSQGQAIKDFIDSLGATGVSMSLSASRGAYMADLAGARAGNETSYGRITQSAGAYISIAGKSAGSSEDLARIVAQIKGQLSGLEPVKNLDANIELLKLIEASTSKTATATGNLNLIGIKAIFDLSQVITFVANSTGIPDDLRKLITDKTKDYQVWLQAQIDSSVSDDLKRILLGQAGVYATVVKATLGTVDAESRKLAITSVGEYTTRVNAALNIIDTDSRKLALTAAGNYYTTVLASLGVTDAASKKLALDAQGNYLTTVNAALGITDPASRKLALDAAGSYLATVVASIGTVDAASQKLAITALGNYQTTVNATMGLADTASQKLALTAAGSYLSTVNASLGIVDADSRKLALTATGGYLTTVTAAMGIADTESRKLALTTVGTFLTTVNAVIGTVDADARTLGLTATNTLNATINAALGVVNTDAKKLALDTTNTINATINAALGTTNADAMKLGLTASNTLAATVTASLGFSDPGAIKLALNTANTIATTVTAAYQGTLTGGSMLTQGKDVALQMATTQSNTLQTLVSAALTGPVANQLSGLLTGIAASDLVTLGGTVTWENSLLALIKNATETTAANTGMYVALMGNGGENYWQKFNAQGVAIQTFQHFTSGGTIAEQAARAEMYRPQRFAEGGIATGSDSGYAATLHGTELVVSPRASYPATVKGGDQSKEQTQVLKNIENRLKNLEMISYQTTKNTGKAAKILDNTLTKWDDLGTPAVAV